MLVMYMHHVLLVLFHIDVVASTCLYAVGLLQTYTLKIAENNNKGALTKISVVIPPIDISIVFTSVQ